MKRLYIPTIILLFLGIIMFVIFTKADTKILSSEEALRIGEEKYLKFLWMVDGVFNPEEEISVNNRKLSNKEKIFKCNKEKDSNKCVAEKLEIEFSKLFSKNITIDKVYSDGIMNSLYEYKNGNYIFNNLNNCNISKMSLEHQIKIVNINSNKLEYIVTFINNHSNLTEERVFNLIKEDNEWKISLAFYYDNCNYRYYIY